MDSDRKSKITIISIFVGAIIIICLFILFIQGGRSKVSISLNGGENIIIVQNEEYIEYGYVLNKKDASEYNVNIDGIVDSSQSGIYYLTYNVYNKKNILVASAIRQVIVLDSDLSDVSITLNGESEEYYFIDDYIDKKVVAYKGSVDISNLVIISSNVNPHEPGQYNVIYQIMINGNIKEVTRIVNIIDYNVQESIQYDKKMINILVDCASYDYTINPAGIKEYSNDISYSFTKQKDYEFDIYLKSGSHKKYVVELSNTDLSSVSGSCSLEFGNNTTKIIVNVSDDEVISKYSYNGLEFTDSTKVINGYVGNVTVKAYNLLDESIDIKCKNTFDYGFKNYDANKLGYIKCGVDMTSDNQKLDAIMQSYGYKTREAVAVAGLFLVNYKYNIPYFLGGKYVHKGLNPKWGCPQQVYGSKVCTKELDGNYCEWGLDCTGLTSWAFAQAGFPYDVIRQDKQSELRWGGDNGKFIAKDHRYSFNSANRRIADLIKPGDLVHRENHVGLVIGVNKDTIQIVEMLGPIFMSTIDKNTGRGLTGQKGFTDFVLMEDFYKLYGNS